MVNFSSWAREASRTKRTRLDIWDGSSGFGGSIGEVGEVGEADVIDMSADCNMCSGGGLFGSPRSMSSGGCVPLLCCSCSVEREGPDGPGVRGVCWTVGVDFKSA
jgi:hypothetical protein